MTILANYDGTNELSHKLWYKQLIIKCILQILLDIIVKC